MVPAALASFVVSAPSQAKVGQAFTVSVTAKDVYGNTVTGYTGPAYLVASDGQTVSPGYIQLTNGVGSGQITLKQADTVALTAILNQTQANTAGYLGFDPDDLPRLVLPHKAQIDAHLSRQLTKRTKYGDIAARLSEIADEGQNQVEFANRIEHGCRAQQIAVEFEPRLGNALGNQMLHKPVPHPDFARYIQKQQQRQKKQRRLSQYRSDIRESKPLSA